MALALGTNCGFVPSTPSSDPGGTEMFFVQVGINKVKGIVCVSPTGTYTATEIGAWLYGTYSSSNYEVGLYSNQGGANYWDWYPNVLLASATGLSTTANGDQWYPGTISYELTSATLYWIVLQLDACASGTVYGQLDNLEGTDRSGTWDGTTLPATWSAGKNNTDGTYAIYALYEAAASGLSIPAKKRGFISGIYGDL
jgi:hypothetical protein